jgi:hypothetical protein
MRSLVGYTAPLIIITFPKGGARGASTTGTGIKNMTATQTELLGEGKNVLVELEKERTALEQGGMNVAISKASVSLVVEEAAAANAQQESLKHQLKAQTELTEAKMKHAYVVILSTIDIMMGAVEKNSPRARIFQRMRSKIRTGHDDTAVEIKPVSIPEANK